MYFRSNKKNIHDAHEGIRPTRFDLPPEKIYKNLTNDQKKLYLLIWNRFVACQMSPAIYKQKTIDIAADEYIFRATDSNLIFDGFLKVWREGKVSQGSDDDSQTYQSLPKLLKVNQSLSLVEIKPQQKFTEPPPRYTEGTLVREMDKRGIGRPSTYATIISTILQRKYVEREKGTLFPSELGKTVNKVLLSGMSDIFNVNFTAKMEEQLDYIESGSKNWADVVDQFYQPFRKSLDVMEANRNVIKGKLQEKTDEICELCGSPMVIKWSRNGRFLSCSAFPKCKNAKPLNKQVETDQESKICPNCKSKMVVKQGRYGKFWACSKYPECKTTLPYTLNIPCPMPDCEGEIVEKKTGRGKIFYGCSNYPSCKFATWNEPINMECPVCSYPILEKKKKRGGETIVFCSKCGTEFSDIET
jgi:DNA topoisomerase-1